MTHIVGFMVSLNRMDKARLTARDILVLFAIKSKPGMNGVELTTSLNLRHRSGIQNSVARLMERSFIEDRRIKEHDLTPSAFHMTQAGNDLLVELTPQ